MYRRFCIASVFSAALALAFAAGKSSAEPDSEKVFELRTYTCHDGKLDQLHARFRDHTNALFVKHGMKLVGYWTPTDKPKSANTLIYIVSHDSRAAAKKSWSGFISDPDWKEAFAKSRENGPIVKKVESTYMKPTDYSPLK